MVHEGNDAVGGHGTGVVESGGGEQRRRVQRHRALGGVEHEQLAPGDAQQSDLVGGRQVREERDVSRPVDGAEEQPRRQLADALDADQPAAASRECGAACRTGARRRRRRRRLGTKKHRHEARQVAAAAVLPRRRDWGCYGRRGERGWRRPGDAITEHGVMCRQQATTLNSFKYHKTQDIYSWRNAFFVVRAL